MLELLVAGFIDSGAREAIKTSFPGREDLRLLFGVSVFGVKGEGE